VRGKISIAAETVKFLWKRKHFEERIWKRKQTRKRLTLCGVGSESKKYSASSTSLIETQKFWQNYL